MFFFLFCFFIFFLVYLSYVSAFLLIACSSSSFVFSFRLRLLLIDRYSSHFKDINLLSLECRCVLHFSLISYLCFAVQNLFKKKKKVWQGQLFHVRISCHTQNILPVFQIRDTLEWPWNHCSAFTS